MTVTVTVTVTVTEMGEGENEGRRLGTETCSSAVASFSVVCLLNSTDSVPCR